MSGFVSLRRQLVIRRLVELFVPTIFFSFLLTLLNVTGVVVQRCHVVLTTIILMLIFTIFNFFNLKECYFVVHDRREYFYINLLSQIIFAIVNLISYAIFPNVLYAWLFSVTKVLTFIDIKTIYSIVLYHLIGIATIWVATIGMDWVFYD